MMIFALLFFVLAILAIALVLVLAFVIIRHIWRLSTKIHVCASFMFGGKTEFCSPELAVTKAHVALCLMRDYGLILELIEKDDRLILIKALDDVKSVVAHLSFTGSGNLMVPFARRVRTLLKDEGLTNLKLTSA
jgi:hypothetical protein